MTIILKLVQIYTLLVFVRCLLGFADVRQNQWVVLLARLTEPAVRLGKSIVGKLFPNRRFSFDISPLSGLIVMLLILYILRIIF